MKKVRIMLFAVLALAIVGGSLAFKAKKSLFVCAYTTTNDEQPLTSICTLADFTNSITTGTTNLSQYAITIFDEDFDNINDCPDQLECSRGNILTAEGN